MDSTNDYKIINSDAGQTAYAKAVAEGLIEFLNLKKKVVIAKNETTTAKKSITEIAKEVIAGKWGNGTARKTKLQAAGYNYSEVQKKVNELSGKKTTPAKKTNEQIAKEVIAGKWGNGSERKKKLTAAGYNYSEIQKIVNKLI